jgi:hypothetical protein
MTANEPAKAARHSPAKIACFFIAFSLTVSLAQREKAVQPGRPGSHGAARHMLLLGKAVGFPQQALLVGSQARITLNCRITCAGLRCVIVASGRSTVRPDPKCCPPVRFARATQRILFRRNCQNCPVHSMYLSLDELRCSIVERCYLVLAVKVCGEHVPDNTRENSLSSGKFTPSKRRVSKVSG